MTMREKWTDERLDDLSARMTDGFNRIDQELRDIRTELRTTQRLVVQVGGGMFVTMAVGFLSVITQL
jgi:hypothetical protein